MLDIRRRSGGKAEQAEQISIWRRRKGHGVPVTSAVRIVTIVGVIAAVVVVVVVVVVGGGGGFWVKFLLLINNGCSYFK